MSQLCTSFRETYRRIKNEPNDEAVTRRHLQLYFCARSLYEAVEFYGEEMNSEMKVYHGLNRVMKFPKFTTHFHQPISTTTSIITAQSFSRGIGIILALKSGSASFNDTSQIPKYLSVSWLSCFPNEDEKLFYGANVMFQIYNIFEAQTKTRLQSHLNELSLLNKFQQMLKNENINWDKESSEMIDALVTLIKQQQISNIDGRRHENDKEEKEKKYDAIESNNKYITKYGQD
eukprot:299067_1